MRVAHIIVDIPLMQTDKPFSYAIPDQLIGLVELGSRVHVPFGKSNRLLQGFIVGFSNLDGDYKEISDLLDVDPVLNSEQLQLADSLRKTVFSYKITLLKAMLPNLLNSHYDKELQVTENTSLQERNLIFNHKSSVLMSQLT